jgi:hypothetical protein
MPKKIRFKPKMKLEEEKIESDPNVLGFTDDSDSDSTDYDDEKDGKTQAESSTDLKPSKKEEVAETGQKKENEILLEKIEPNERSDEKRVEQKVEIVKPPVVVKAIPARFVAVHR